MTTMSVKTVLKTVPELPSNVSVLFRGNHGIGKSQVVRQIAEILREQKPELGAFEVIDRRLSQMTEGDIIGLPSTDGNVTRFNPPDWFKDACENPKCLFLDELNRATPEVMQAAFQIVLDRTLNGWKLHPNTYVFSAINISGAYNVNEVDPALLDRFWVSDLDPTREDWLDWAKSRGKVMPLIVDFIVDQDKWLDPSKTPAEPNGVQPSRRSWERLSEALVHAKLDDNAEDPRFYTMCLGFVGTEATIALHTFAKQNDLNVSGKDIVENYKKVQSKVARFTQDHKNAAIDKVADYVQTQVKLTDKQGKNVAEFMSTLGEELKINLWSKLVKSGVEKIELAKSVHKHCVEQVLGVFGVPMGEAGIGVVPNIPGIFKDQQAKK